MKYELGERLETAIGQKRRTNQTRFSFSHVFFDPELDIKFSANFLTLSDAHSLKTVGQKKFRHLYFYHSPLIRTFYGRKNETKMSRTTYVKT